MNIRPHPSCYPTMWLLVILLWASACQPASSTPAPARVTLPPVTFPPTPTASETPTRFPRPTNVTTPVWTALPTLPPEEADALLVELLQTNGGCQFPCWWGITPGETDWLTAAQFLGSFSRQPVEVEAEVYDGILHYLFVAGFQVGEESEVLFAYIFSQDGIVFRMVLDRNISLSRILILPIVPNRVEFIIRTDENEELFAEDVSSVWMALDYPEHGMHIVFYSGIEVFGEGKIITACYGSADNYWFIESLTTREAYDSSSSSEPHLILEKATIFDIDTFVETFSDPDNKPCIEISLDAWVAP